MADSCLEFSEILPHITVEEEAWLRAQLEIVYVFGDQEYPEGNLPEELDPAEADWYGCRAWRDLEDCDPDEGDPVGFAWESHDDRDTPESWGRHVWFHAEQYGDPWRVAHLVQKFLRQFRPDQGWSLTYALTCLKPCAGEFGGGGVFVAAKAIRFQDAHDFVAACQGQFASRSVPSATGNGNAEPSQVWEVARLPQRNGRSTERRFVLYDSDRRELATTCVYDHPAETAGDASALANVIMLPIVIGAATEEEEGPATG